MRKLRRFLLGPYHFAWAICSALLYGFPAKKMTVIGVTGTKGKTSVTEMLYTILTYAKHPTALAGTIRFAQGNDSRPNLYKMTLPGRGFAQRFLAEAVKKGCTHAVVEITSEAALQYRHFFLELNALVFTNLQREHIESHGSMEKYFKAKFKIGEALVASHKRPRVIIANEDDPRGRAFLDLPVEQKVPFSKSDAQSVVLGERQVAFTYRGVDFMLFQPGHFSIMNALAAIKTAEALGVSPEISAEALATLMRIPGRAERIEAGQKFTVVVDYAHTPDSLRALYAAFPTHRKICVLGNTGAGRDAWKRPEMGRIADDACEEVILTNEDPYDEDPARIVMAMAGGMSRTPAIIMDRREAIRHALSLARPGDAVLITGKGTDPFIMGPRGEKTPWSDAQVVKEELDRLLKTS